MITGLTDQEAAALAREHRCACGGVLLNSWGGTWGIDGPVVRCLNNLEHQAYQSKRANIRQIGDKEYNVATQHEIVRADKRIDLTASNQPQEGGVTLAVLQRTSAQLKLVEQFVKEVMREGEDFGKVRGIDQPFLWKSGAENLASLFGCHATFEQMERVVEPASGFVLFQHRCRWVHNNTGVIVLEGMGSCNSFEVKYRYREMKRSCPKCKAATIRKGAGQYGGGWYCSARDGGCGAKYKDGDSTIEEQKVGREQNPDLLDGINTYMKMSMKRANTDCAMRAPGVARFFAVDHNEETRAAAEEAEEEARNRPRQSAPVGRGAAPASAPASTTAQRPPTPAGHCQGHNAPMQQSRRTGKVAHVLADGAVCEGIPAQHEPGNAPVGAEVPENQGVEVPEGLPSSHLDDVEELKAAVAKAGLEWQDFEMLVLKMTWPVYTTRGWTVANARNKLETYLLNQQGGA